MLVYIFETFVEVFVEWAIQKSTCLDNVKHYLDDFIFAGGAKAQHYEFMTAFEATCREFGVQYRSDPT